MAMVGLFVFACGADDEGVAPEDGPAAAPPRRRKDADSRKAPPEFAPEWDASTAPDPDEDPAPREGERCVDEADPGGAENVATVLPVTDDCDNDYKLVRGVANGAVDVDFFKLSATDKGVSPAHPVGCAINANFETSTAGAELCVFLRCKNSTANAVTGCESGTAATSDIGMKGCCTAGPGSAVPTWDCSGISDNDSADIFIRVRQINGDKCLPYSVRYRF